MVKPSILGLSYRTAGLDLRAKASFTDNQKLQIIQRLQQVDITQCFIVSTCNRTEIYYLQPSLESDKADIVKDIFLQLCDPEQLLLPHLYQLEGIPALEQLFRVTAGLDSLVLGEDQILGQIQQAMAFSKAVGASGKELNRIFQNAVTCAKELKTAYPISNQPLSLCYIGMKKMQQVFPVAQKTACVLGSGKMALLAIRYLMDMQAKKIFLCCRNTQQAQAIQKEYPDRVEWRAFSQRATVLQQSDWVISATAAPHFVITKEELQGYNTQKKMVFLDLAVPRDICPQAVQEISATIFDIDSLKETEKENQQKRIELAKQSEQLLTKGVEQTWQWLARCQVDAPIQTLQQRVQEIEQDTADLLCQRLGLDTHQQKILRKLLRAGMNRLLRNPIHQLKEIEDFQQQQKLAQAVEYLFSKTKE